jgi:hypothetical protein
MDDIFDWPAVPILPLPALPVPTAHHFPELMPEVRRSARLKAKHQLPSLDKAAHILLAKMGIAT